MTTMITVATLVNVVAGEEGRVCLVETCVTNETNVTVAHVAPWISSFGGVDAETICWTDIDSQAALIVGRVSFGSTSKRTNRVLTFFVS